MNLDSPERQLVYPLGDIRLAAVEGLGHLERLPVSLQVRRERLSHNLCDWAVLMSSELLKLPLE